MWDSDNKYVFDFEKLKVYEMGMEFVGKIFKVTKELTATYQFSIGEQLRRAALSIVNNIAEGSGKISKKEKSQFYRVSLNSARECVPMLTILTKENLISPEQHGTLRQDCIHICNMLGKLIAAV